ncbi:efflux RND transporter periplasmic adaptor subunit [Lachnotalea glycerini]|uniref:Efflux RND transporter periplasmic adaptor subunit n=2 Tax=Lachnotalea glycerini TaxID=1763509 RepID=A0A371JCR9_9FIRM|nr:efflux RND transporter periplasmic adaptor subunit [Lachnotalea glycerini]
MLDYDTINYREVTMSVKVKSKELIEKMKAKLASKNKKVFISLAIAAILIVSGVVAANVYASSSKENDTVYKETQVQYGNLTVGITESGTTSIGTETIDYDVTAVSVSKSSSSTSSSSTSSTSSSSTSSSSSSSGNSSSSSSTTSSSSSPALEVEEVYVASSQSVNEGDQILKVTDKSYQKVLNYLESAVKTATLNVENEKIEQQLAQNDADYTYKSNSSKNSTASAEYNATAQDLKDAVEEASDAITDWEDTVSTFTEEWNAKYYEQYDIDGLIEKCDKYSALIDKYKEEVSTLKETMSTLKEQITELETQISSYDSTQNNEKTLDELNTELTSLKESYSTAKSSLSTAKSNLSTAKSDYETAYSNYESGIASYEEMVAEGETALAEKEAEYDTLKAEYDEKVAKQTEGLIDAEQSMKEEQITSNNADTLYNIETNGLDDDLTEAEETLEDAQEALDTFNSLVVDSIVKANFSGTIISVGYVAGDEISSSTSIVTYGNPDEVTISVSVDQEDVASIAVNDTVNIEFTAYEGTAYEGTVSEIATSPTSEKSSTVSYAVTVKVNGDVSTLYSGMTANVTFITKEMDNVLYVSNKAIITEDTKTYVKVKNSDGTIEEREVTTGFSDGSNVEVVSGLSEGETALIESQVKSE